MQNRIQTLIDDNNLGAITEYLNEHEASVNDLFPCDNGKQETMLTYAMQKQHRDLKDNTAEKMEQVNEIINLILSCNSINVTQKILMAKLSLV